MTNLYCSQGHQNPPDSKFCLHCGEKIWVNAVNNAIVIGQILSDRYSIIKQIGR
ncbi:zinc ribbon domain-containing protein [Anabaena sp. FACHB-1237]|uniref:zinc ribbon domain-containing protein n=1 Tax=Anabaena sp. FACHB-1237 TaxID=2692769 RepID=UPI0016817DA4|nr:zinc ribbon domain-containing protein [Anabaena sp. FACHB-1237]MBD2139264.1 zinc ribbon domain-containing protein [Anabaena sp. FACHB-1237]